LIAFADIFVASAIQSVNADITAGVRILTTNNPHNITFGIFPTLVVAATGNLCLHDREK